MQPEMAADADGPRFVGVVGEPQCDGSTPRYLRDSTRVAFTRIDPQFTCCITSLIALQDKPYTIEDLNATLDRLIAFERLPDPVVVVPEWWYEKAKVEAEAAGYDTVEEWVHNELGPMKFVVSPHVPVDYAYAYNRHRGSMRL